MFVATFREISIVPQLVFRFVFPYASTLSVSPLAIPGLIIRTFCSLLLSVPRFLLYYLQRCTQLSIILDDL